MNRVSRLALAWLVLSGLLWEGCTTERTVRLGTRRVTFDEVFGHVSTNANNLRTFQAEGDLTIETPSFSQSATVRVLLRKPDTLMLTVHGPFGIRVGSALMTPTSFRFYNSLQNKEYVGAASPDNLQKVLHVDLTYDDIVSLFTGGAFLSGDSRDPASATTEGEDAVFRFAGGTYDREYRVDGASMMIRQILLLDDKGAPVVEQSFDKFESTGDVNLPRAVRLTFHKTRRRISLHYGSFIANASLPPLELEVPATAEKVELQ